MKNIWTKNVFSEENLKTALMLKILGYFEGEISLHYLFELNKAIKEQKSVQINKQSLLSAMDIIRLLEDDIEQGRMEIKNTYAINNRLTYALEALISHTAEK